MSNIKLYRLLLFTLISFSFTSMAQNLENSINEIKKEYAPDKRIAVLKYPEKKYQMTIIYSKENLIIRKQCALWKIN